MRPRIFISSTYYDLKHVRERLERFIGNYLFEPVLFESDNVFYEHNRPIDLSCYEEVKQCHMMILIIGGRYGSISSGENAEEVKKIYNSTYISVTRKEYETAISNNMPVFIFVDKNVYAEYQTYRKNYKILEPDSNLFGVKSDFTFAHVDDIQVFQFIGKLSGKAIKTFERIEDIERYLANQFAGMMHSYLNELQNQEKDRRVIDSVGELKRLSEQMNEMLQAVGQNVIEAQNFQKVVDSQNRILIDFYINQFMDNIVFSQELEDFSREKVDHVFNVIENTLLNAVKLSSISKDIRFELKSKKYWELFDEFKAGLMDIDNRLIIEHIDAYKVSFNFLNKIHPILVKDKKLRDFFESRLKDELYLDISGLPF